MNIYTNIERIAEYFPEKGNALTWERLWRLVQRLPEPLLSDVVVEAVRDTPLADGGTVWDLLTDAGEYATRARLAWACLDFSDGDMVGIASDAWDGVFSQQAPRAVKEAALAAVWTASPGTKRDAERYAAWGAAYAAAWHRVWVAAGSPELDPDWDDAVGDEAWDAARYAQAKIVSRVLREAVPV